LQETGIEIDTPVFKGVLYFDLGLIIGDNLGIHSIIGITESFSSNYSCRICTIKKNDLKFQCYEDESLLRSIDQYYMLRTEQSKCHWHKRKMCVVRC